MATCHMYCVCTVRWVECICWCMNFIDIKMHGTTIKICVTMWLYVMRWCGSCVYCALTQHSAQNTHYTCDILPHLLITYNHIVITESLPKYNFSYALVKAP